MLLMQGKVCDTQHSRLLSVANSPPPLPPALGGCCPAGMYKRQLFSLGSTYTLKKKIGVSQVCLLYYFGSRSDTTVQFVRQWNSFLTEFRWLEHTHTKILFVTFVAGMFHYFAGGAEDLDIWGYGLIWQILRLDLSLYWAFISCQSIDRVALYTLSAPLQHKAFHRISQDSKFNFPGHGTSFQAPETETCTGAQAHGQTGTRAHVHRHVHWHAFFPSHSARESRRIPSFRCPMSLSTWHMQANSLFLFFARALSLSHSLTNTHTPTHTHTFAHTSTHMQANTHKPWYTHTHTLTHIHSPTHTHTHTHTQTFTHHGNWASRYMILRVRKAEESRSIDMTPSAHDSWTLWPLHSQMTMPSCAGVLE